MLNTGDFESEQQILGFVEYVVQSSASDILYGCNCNITSVVTVSETDTET